MTLRSLGLSSHALVDYLLERGGMQVHDAVGGETTENHSVGLQLVYGWLSKYCVSEI